MQSGPEKTRVREAQRIVVVDLDHTLLLHDTLHEQLARMLFQPARLPGLFAAFTRGKAALKAYCTDHIDLNLDALKTSADVIAFIESERANGSRIVLCTAADARLANKVADHVGLFDEVIGTENGNNLKGAAKAELLATRFPGGFIYAADHSSDLAVWKKSQGIVLVGANARTAEKARQLEQPILQEFPKEGHSSTLRAWVNALRMHHWAKNLLIFVPVMLAHQWSDFALLTKVFLGLLLLLATTSASYVVNDLADLDADRQHATKRTRPIASGDIPITQAIAFAVFTIPVAIFLAFLFNPWFGSALLTYLVLTLGYSFGLKSIPLLDVFIIGLLFTIRLVMGTVFIDTALPLWLLTFSMFFFFSLAMAKRHTEIMRANTIGGDSIAFRGYEAADWPLTLAIGISAGLGSLIILVLYMVEEAFRVVGYTRPPALWLIALLLAIWIGRIWLLTHRGRMNDDPVVFALKDRVSQVIAVAIGLCFLVAV